MRLLSHFSTGYVTKVKDVSFNIMKPSSKEKNELSFRKSNENTSYSVKFCLPSRFLTLHPSSYCFWIFTNLYRFYSFVSPYGCYR